MKIMKNISNKSLSFLLMTALSTYSCFSMDHIKQEQESEIKPDNAPETDSSALKSEIDLFGGSLFEKKWDEYCIEEWDEYCIGDILNPKSSIFHFDKNDLFDDTILKKQWDNQYVGSPDFHDVDDLQSLSAYSAISIDHILQEIGVKLNSSNMYVNDYLALKKIEVFTNPLILKEFY